MSEKNNFKKISFVALGGAVVVAGGLIGASAMLRSPAIALKTDSQTTSTYATEKTITVKGVAERVIISDKGAMNVVFYCNAKDIPGGYELINKHNKQVLDTLAKVGITAGEIKDVRINYEEVFEYKTVDTVENGKKKSTTEKVFQHYRFSRSFRIVSNNVNAIEQASVSLYDLLPNGVEISVDAPQYFVSNQEQYKLELVDAATASAYQRAQTLAAKSGAQLGPLRLARQGIIQITRPASNDTSDYGVYDTTSINKVMRLVVTLDFSLKK